MSQLDAVVARSPGEGRAPTPLEAEAEADIAARAVVATARDGGILFAGKLFTYASRLVITIMLARTFGDHAYGAYNLSLTLAELAVAASVLGFDTGLLRFVAIFTRRGEPARTWGVLQLGIGLPLLVALAIAAGAFAFAPAIAVGVFDDPGLGQPLRVASLIVPILLLINQLDAALRGLARMRYAVLAQQFVQPLVRLGLTSMLLVFGISVPLAIGAYVFAAACASVLMVGLLHRTFSLRRPVGIVPGDGRRLVAFSWPVYASSLVSMVGDSLNKVLLGATASVAAVGVFAVASHVNLIGTVFHGSITSASMPVIAALHDGRQHDALSRLYRSTTKWAVTVNLPVFLVLVILPEAILGIFGRDFQAGATALVILAAANLAQVGTGPCGAIIDMTGNTRLKLVNTLVLVALAIVISLTLIPAYGLLGAAVTSLLVTLILNLLRVAEVYVLLRLLPYDRSIAKPALAGLAAAVAATLVRALEPGWPAAILALATAVTIVVVFIALLLALGLSDEDREVLRRGSARLRRRMGRR